MRRSKVGLDVDGLSVSDDEAEAAAARLEAEIQAAAALAADVGGRPAPEAVRPLSRARFFFPFVEGTLLVVSPGSLLNALLCLQDDSIVVLLRILIDGNPTERSFRVKKTQRLKVHVYGVLWSPLPFPPLSRPILYFCLTDTHTPLFSRYLACV